MLVTPGKKTVTVVDSIMGSGKTSMAIKLINESPMSKKFIYIPPYLSEIDRIIANTNREFVQPEQRKNVSKLDSFKKEVVKGSNIAASHELFKRCDKELLRLLEAENYVLIVDEAMDVIKEVEITKADIQILLNSFDDNGQPIIEVDEKGLVKWNNDKYDYGKFSDIRNLANAGKLMLHGNSKMYWLFPVDIFKSFSEVYILTYLFKGQIQSYYFDLFKVKYEFKSVGYSEAKGYHLISYIQPKHEDRNHFKNLIKIYYSPSNSHRDINKIGERHNAFSKSDFDEITKDKHLKKVIKDNAYNFYRNKIGCSTKLVIWTTFKDYEKSIIPTGLRDSFVSINAKATNDYAEATCCIYLANRYMNPIIKQYFQKNGIKVNEELFALSELLQWLFRSNIRKGGEINVYIPSSRMRSLLEQYLNNEI